jgi:hypothetical protein
MLMLFAPYLAEISLVLYFDILQNVRYFRQIKKLHSIMREGLSEGPKKSLKISNSQMLIISNISATTQRILKKKIQFVRSRQRFFLIVSIPSSLVVYT